MNPNLWSAVRRALKAELEPEDPAATAPYVAMRFKYVARIAQVEGVALALIGMRENRGDPVEFDFFKAYNLDLSSGTKGLVDSEGFNAWRWLKWARLRAGSYLDAVFLHQSCTECEAYYLLSSFYFDPMRRAWRLRDWPEDGNSLVIGSDVQFGEEDDWETTCLYTIRDLTNDGAEDIVIWCKETGRTTKKVVETTTLYAVEEGGPTRRELVEEASNLMRRDLCRESPKSPLCK